MTFILLPPFPGFVNSLFALCLRYSYLLLIFCKRNESNVGYLRCIPLLFEAMFGLRVN